MAELTPTSYLWLNPLVTLSHCSIFFFNEGGAGKEDFSVALVQCSRCPQYCTLSVDLILQELLHCLLFSNVQRRLTFTVHNSYIGTLADEIPATTVHTQTFSV